ncbi:MAG: hypothetical protein HRU19_04750 [Pseudobacteriovorax sp.]|nr:hypothetical protein [Pseudobacteriovorax sp.]
MKTSSAKAKGRRAAAELKALILYYYPSLTEDDVRLTPSGLNGPDILLSAEARRQFPFSVEVKNQERLKLWDAIAQAEANKAGSDTPLLVFRRNRSKLYVCLEANEFLKIIS